MKILETDRLILRTFEEKDAPMFFALNKDFEVIQYTGDVPFTSEEEALKFIQSYDAYQRNGFGRWAVIFKETGKFIGFCGLKFNEENQVDLGFRFFKTAWGQGFATEAAKSCINYGFSTLGLQEIIGRALPLNLASIKVLEKCGMHFFKQGTCHGMDNARYYKIEKEDWKMNK